MSSKCGGQLDFSRVLSYLCKVAKFLMLQHVQKLVVNFICPSFGAWQIVNSRYTITASANEADGSEFVWPENQNELVL